MWWWTYCRNWTMIETDFLTMAAHQPVKLKLSGLVPVNHQFVPTTVQLFAEMEELKEEKNVMMETWSTVTDVQTDVKKKLPQPPQLTTLDQPLEDWAWLETLTQTSTTFLLFWRQIKNSVSPMRTKWKASWRLNSQIHQLFHQFIVLKEKPQIWICSTVWQFTAVEFQIKNTKYNFHITTRAIQDSSQSTSILLPVLLQQDQQEFHPTTDDLTQFIIHDDS